MKRLRQLFIISLALSIAIIPVNASMIHEQDQNVTITENRSQDIEVTAEVASSFTVIVPKEVNLSSDTFGSGTYTANIPITVKGDIAINELITVDTADSIKLEDDKSNSVHAVITKGKTEFNFDDLTGDKEVTANHLVTAELTPGEWEGTAEFYINLGVDKNYIGQINEYGFYFDVQYVAKDLDYGSEYGVVLHKDGTADLYTNGFYVDTTTAVYSEKFIIQAKFVL